jgi:hypothetical protein
MIRCPRVILQAVVPLSTFSIPDQMDCPSNFFLSPTLDLCGSLFRGLISITHYVNLTVTLRA